MPSTRRPSRMDTSAVLKSFRCRPLCSWRVRSTGLQRRCSVARFGNCCYGKTAFPKVTRTRSSGSVPRPALTLQAVTRIPSLRTLHLADSNIGDGGAALFAHALPQLQLRELAFADTAFTSVGCAALLRAVLNGSRLEGLTITGLENFVCQKRLTMQATSTMAIQTCLPTTGLGCVEAVVC